MAGGRKMASLVAVLWLLMAAEMCRGWVEEAVQDVKDNISEVSENANLDEKAEAIKKGATEAYHDAKEKAESWSNWAYDKISKGFGKNEEELRETAHYVVDKASDAASGASNYASEKAGEAVRAASTAGSSLKSKSENVAEAAAEKAGDMKTKAKETIVIGKEKAAEAYEAAKGEVGQKMESAKENLSCENCREKVSQAAGEIGARIKEKTAEL